MEESQKEECTSVVAYPARSEPSSVPEYYHHVFSKDNMEELGDKL